MVKLSGRCMCRKVTWNCDGAVTRSLVCHCQDCQRATSSPFTAFIGVKPDEVRWSGAINHYQSSEQTWRGFCPACGTRLYFKSGKWPAEIHIHASTLDENCAYKPSAQVVLRSRADWLDDLHSIPKYQDFHANPTTDSKDS